MATKEQTDAAHEIKATNLTTEERAFLAEHADELADSTLRAKWIHSPDEAADRPGQTLATQSRQVIEAWAEERGGRPATVDGTEHGKLLGVLRIDFGEPTDRLREVSWDEWFNTFDERNLEMIFQEHRSDGRQSNFFRLLNPDREDG